MVHRFAFAFTTLAVLLTAAAGAQTRNGRFEIYGGSYWPQGLDREFTYGLRGGAKLSDHFGIEGSVGRFSIDFDPVNVDFTLTDLSFKGYLTSGTKADFFLFAGPGWAFVTAKAFGAQARVDSFSAHLGAGLDIQLTDRLYLRPDVRGRWFQKGDDNSLDWEATVALGFTF